ncbi:axin-2 [Brachyhypopomus gauderio]|uniref:axin-2 n=1 Tax=Brachyhypopomus gauderio TaxID=698409 RepID=UPI0040422A15
MNRALTHPITSSFREDAPRPPVPGEEGETKCYNPSKLAMMRPKETFKSVVVAPPGSAARRDEDGLGEPEGSASPDSPQARWTKSLHSLLGDQDGAQLFREFLEREKCVDTLDFWFACNGFRQMDIKDAKTLRVAKAIYKRYIENTSVVSTQLKPATKTFIRDNVKRQQVDSAMFDQAQTEIQTTMEENAYQMFLTSDMYLEFGRGGCENPPHVNPNGLGSLKLVCGYLPTLNEEEEWTCNDLRAKALAVVGLTTKALRSAPSLRTVEVLEKGYRSCRRGDPSSSYHVISGCSFAPATSANDSEISSDAATDDSMSVTDSSVDGIPPYKLGSKKHLQREMQRNMRVNGHVTLPPFPKVRPPPKEMAPVEPAMFAALLIARLERLQREQETMSSLEERLQQIQEEEEREEAELSTGGGGASHSLPLLPVAPCEDDAQAILDEHLSRVLKTPGCRSPRCRSPELRPLPRGATGGPRPLAGPASANSFPPVRTLAPRPSAKLVHHHYIHHHSTPKSKEQIETEAAQKVQGVCPGPECCRPPHVRTRSLGREQAGHAEPAPLGCPSALSKRLCKSGEEVADEGVGVSTLQLPADNADRSQNVWQWILASDRQARHRPHSTQSTRKLYGSDSTRSPAWSGATGAGQARTHQPAHPFVQDPAMPPLPPPNTLAQLEEACRRLEEVSKPPKQRHSTPGLPRDRTQTVPVQSSAVTLTDTHTGEQMEPKQASGGPAAVVVTETVVTYFFCGEDIPYRRMMKNHSLTLGHFKEQLRKKGNYRYYFKKASEEFECGAVFEEVWDDGSSLPMYEGKILGKVERMD